MRQHGARNYRTRWLLESPQKFVQEYRLPQIPAWYEVFDTPLNEETADPIALQDILGSVFIYLGGVTAGCVVLLLELVSKGLTVLHRYSKKNKV